MVNKFLNYLLSFLGVAGTNEIVFYDGSDV